MGDRYDIRLDLGKGKDECVTTLYMVGHDGILHPIGSCVEVGHVLLEGFEYGFFGGACGVVGDEFIVNGDLYAHPDGERIEDFVRAQGFRVVSFEGIPLCDIGSIIEV